MWNESWNLNETKTCVTCHALLSLVSCTSLPLPGVSSSHVCVGENSVLSPSSEFLDGAPKKVLATEIWISSASLQREARHRTYRGLSIRFESACTIMLSPPVYWCRMYNNPKVAPSLLAFLPGLTWRLTLRIRHEGRSNRNRWQQLGDLGWPSRYHREEDLAQTWLVHITSGGDVLFFVIPGEYVPRWGTIRTLNPHTLGSVQHWECSRRRFAKRFETEQSSIQYRSNDHICPLHCRRTSVKSRSEGNSSTILRCICWFP